MADIRKWFMKAHDKDNGSASKHAKSAPSNLEKPATAELQSGKTGLSGGESTGRRITSKYFASEKQKSKDAKETVELPVKRKSPQDAKESPAKRKSPQDSEETLKATPLKKLNKIDDNENDSVLSSSRKNLSDVTPNKKLKSGSGRGITQKPVEIEESDDEEAKGSGTSLRPSGRGRGGRASSAATASGRGRGGGRGGFMNFGERKDPPHKGEKEVPEGAPDCLNGLTFVISGTLDSLEREEAEDLIKRHGGRVTGSVSKKTKYLLCDEDIGGRKSSKAKELGTAFLTEDGLFDMIRASSGTKAPTREESKKSVVKSVESPKEKNSQKVQAKTRKDFTAGASPAKQKDRTVEFSSLTWTEKYKPKVPNDIIGNQSLVKQLHDWLAHWNENFLDAQSKKKGKKLNDSGAKKAVLLCGGPGIGKTTSAKLVSQMLGYQAIEVNASDNRGKSDAKIEKGISGSNANSIKELISNESLHFRMDQPKHPKTVLIMDEVDGMSAGDRGGVADLIASIKISKIPIICICNDRYSQKLKSLVNYCLILSFRKPTKQQMAKRLIQVANAEGLQVNEIALEELAEKVNGDMRMALNQLQYMSLSMSVIKYDDIRQRLLSSMKDEDISPFTAVDKLFGFNSGKLRMDERIDLSMSDPDLVPLLIQENYINYRPSSVSKDDNGIKRMDFLARAAESIADGDIINVQIRRHRQWQLSQSSSIASSVIPASLLHGQRETLEQGERNFNRFSAWLGKNSTFGKNMRLLEDLHVHILASRESCSGREHLRVENLTLFLKRLTEPLHTLPKLGILKVLEVMEPAAELVFPIYVIAGVDCHEPVVKRGEELLKKKASSANLDDQRLINKLFLLFNGTTGSENTASESRVKPGSIALKGKLMSLFCRSIAAANSFPSTLQCIFGCIYGNGTTSRLKQLGMEFTVWVFKHANSDQLRLMSPVILNGILKSLDGYSKSALDSTTRDTKIFAFQAIGLLAQRMPQLFRDKIDMAVRLFDALKMEVPSLRFVVQEATNSLTAAYKEAPDTVLKELEALLLKNSQEEESEVRFCAVRWATKLFHLQHCPSRFICMLAAADSKLDIREMALEGLFGVKGEGRTIIQNHDVKHPKFGVMLDYILKQQPMLLCSTELREQQLLFPSQTYIAMIKFLLECFEAELQQDDSSEASSTHGSSVETMCHFLEHAMAYEGSVELHSTAFKALITIGSYLPEVIAKHYALKVSWIKHFLSHIDFDTRESAARLLGIASSALTTSASSTVIEELLTSVSGIHNLRFETQHGVLCAIGFVTADCVSKIPIIPQTLLEDTLKCLVGVVKSETAAISSVAMQALGHIGLHVPLPPLRSNSESVDVLMVLHDKLGKLLLGDDINAIQKILLSIGHICFKETSSTCLNVALDLIFHLCRCKVEDILFAAGEALSFLWGGVPVTADVILKTNYASLSSASNFLGGDVNSYWLKYKCNVAGADETSESFHAAVRDSIATKLFDDLLYSTRKEERCAGAVWLVSLAMYCGNHPAIQQILPQIQEAFLNLLGEQNELVQELVSQGMSIVYELGDSSMKTNLVNALVSTLTGSGKKKRAIKLVEDTEVFQEAIGENPSGGKLSTYKELCSLANEMGQPDLIYKFMDLANHQASLNSKRGAAFGFSKIAKQAEDALKPHLRSLIPRLVRYQYDPDKNVQDAMVHIWKSLVDDSKKTIDENLDVIVTDLIIQSGSRLWRSREASCLALADIIQGRRFSQVEKHLEKLWSVAFRAMDDIKETVRNSGDKLLRAITSLSIRLCDVSLTELADASKAMDTVLPFLLSEGMMSKVDSVRKASIGVVMKLAKGAGPAIRPQLSHLVCCMLESLSSLEDQGLNYIELHAANVGMQTDKLENLRISIAKGSPMWETLDLCIKVVDDESLYSLIPRLAHLIRSGVGLNTRVGVANFVTLLVQKVGPDIKSYTNMLLRLLFPVVKEEKSVAAKRAFAAACAIVMKFSAQSQVQKLVEDTTSLHTGDRNDQISCALLLKSYSSMASDVLSGYLVAVVPVIFVSRFEDDKHVSGLFEELWEENTSGERVTLQLYLGEIVSLICNGITSSSWTSKKKSAQAICKLCEVLGESISFYHHVLLQSLMKDVSGHIWEGKDAILNALGAISTACHKLISAADPALPNAIVNLVSSACSKKVKKFREAAFSCLEQVIKAFGSPQFFNMVFPLLFEACKSADSGQAPLGGDVAKTESDDRDKISIPREKILNCLTSSIQVADLDDVIEQQKNLVYLITTSLSNGFRWTVKTSTFSSINELCTRFREALHGFQGRTKLDSTISFVLELSHSVSPLLVQCITTVKIAQVHISASECLLEIIKLYTDLPSVHQTDIVVKAELLHLCEIEKNEVAKSLLKTCIENLENLEQDKVQEG